MANLEVQIGADSGEFMSEIAKVEKQLSLLKNQQAANIKLGIDTSTIDKQITETTTKLNGLKNSVGSSATAFNNHSKAAANGGNTLMQFSRIAQDAPFGIVGIGNNLTATAESFGHLARSSGGAGNALKAVASSIMGTGGILLAVSLVTSGLTYMSQKGISVADVFDKLSGNFNEYAEAFKKANLAAYNDEGVVKAVGDVNQLREEVKLAKDGFIDKSKVVEHYNETMGKTTGIVSSLDAVEQQLVKNGDAYIKMQLYKATATLAQAEAAKEMLNQEKISKQSAKDHTGVLEYVKGAMVGVASGQGLMSTGMFATIEGIKSQNQAFSDSGKKMSANMSIAQKYNKMAAELGKSFGFNFFEDNKAAKTPKTKTDTYAIERELQDKLKAMNAIAFTDKIALIDSYSKLELSKRQKLKDDILKQEENYNKSILDGQNKLSALSAFAKSEQYNNEKQERQKSFEQAQADIQAHEDFLANVGKTGADKKAEEDKAKYSADLVRLKSYLAQKLITQEQYDALAFESAVANNDRMATIMQDFNNSLNDILVNGAISTLSNFGQSIGDALGSGGNILKAAGNSLLASLGSILVQLGQLAIQTGIGILAVKKSLKTLNPYVAIAAGVGLVALGSYFSSKSKSIGGSMGGSGGGGESGGAMGGNIQTGADVSSPTSSVSSGGTFNNSGGTVVFEIAGQKLIGVLNNTMQGNLRLGGSGLAG